MAERTSVDPAIGCTVVAKALPQRVAPFNPGPAMLHAVLPTGTGVSVKGAETDVPAETSQEATCLFLVILTLGALQGIISEAEISYCSVHFGGGWGQCPGRGEALVVYLLLPLAICHLPTAGLQLGAAGAQCAIVPCHFHSTTAGTGQLGARTCSGTAARCSLPGVQELLGCLYVILCAL